MRYLRFFRCFNVKLEFLFGKVLNRLVQLFPHSFQSDFLFPNGKELVDCQVQETHCRDSSHAGPNIRRRRSRLFSRSLARSCRARRADVPGLGPFFPISFTFGNNMSVNTLLMFDSTKGTEQLLHVLFRLGCDGSERNRNRVLMVLQDVSPGSVLLALPHLFCVGIVFRFHYVECSPAKPTI